MSISIEVVTSESDDWSVILFNGEVDYAGHHIPNHYWINLLNNFGFNIKSRVISDKDMEEDNFYE